MDESKEAEISTEDNAEDVDAANDAAKDAANDAAKDAEVEPTLKRSPLKSDGSKGDCGVASGLKGTD